MELPPQPDFVKKMTPFQCHGMMCMYTVNMIYMFPFLLPAAP